MTLKSELHRLINYASDFILNHSFQGSWGRGEVTSLESNLGEQEPPSPKSMMWPYAQISILI